MEIAIFTLIVLLFSVMAHEIAHGSVAYQLGDPTAKNVGRLTLNPIKHIDPLGSIIVPISMFIFTAGMGPVFGWAKPVPINPYNFRDKKWGALKVAVAGPATNFLIALIIGLFIRFASISESLYVFLGIIVFYNFLLGIFNLLPIPPLDGSWILFSLLPEKFMNIRLFLSRYGFFILIIFLFWGIGIIDFATGFLYSAVVGR